MNDNDDKHKRASSADAAATMPRQARPRQTTTKPRSVLRLLPSLKQPYQQKRLTAKDMADKLHDLSSLTFYLLVADKIPAVDIYPALSQITKDPNVKSPPRVFNTRMHDLARRQLTRHLGARKHRIVTSVGD